MAHSRRRQNFWELACINGAALGLPGMLVGGALAQSYGATSAFLSVLIGNIFLWIVGLGIIFMAENEEHAIENVRGYLGKFTSVIAALVWVLSFLVWYTLQIQSVSIALSVHLHELNDWIVGVFLGTWVALLAIGGLKLIKWSCVIGLPLMVCYVIYALLTVSKIADFSGEWLISGAGVLAIILIWLPGTVNLPTFFRHARSRPDKVLGLILMMFFHVFFQSSAILLSASHPKSLLAGQGMIGTAFVIGFILLSFTLINLLNIYYASAGWETIFPVKHYRIEYFLVGVFGALIYVAFSLIPPTEKPIYTMELVESTLSSFIASLGVVLLISFLIRMIVKHRPKPFEKLWSSLCWLIGCITSLWMHTQAIGVEKNKALLAGVVATALSFLVIMFIEETTWAVKHVRDENKKESSML